MKKLRYKIALSRVQRLEQRRHFISPFFCGETMYPIELAKWDKRMEKAKLALDKSAPKESV